MPKQPDLDTLGASASLMCAVHCAGLPLIVSLAPALGLGFLRNEAIEWVLVGLSAVLGLSSLSLGFRQHRRWNALAVLASGLSLVAVGRMAEEHEITPWGVMLVVAGGVTIAGAHLLNRRLCHHALVCQGDACSEAICSSDTSQTATLPFHRSA